jgi:prevent-host-death family protein
MTISTVFCPVPLAKCFKRSRRFQSFSKVWPFLKVDRVRVGVAQAKNELARLIKIAERGQVITILRHGHPVAELRRVEPQPRQQEDDDDPFADVFGGDYNFEKEK